MSGSRREKWSEFSEDSRWRLAADDLDTHDEQFKHFDGEISSVKKLLIGILMSTATASIMLAINLLVGKP